MKRVLGGAAAVVSAGLAVALLAAPAVPAPAAQQARVACGGKAVTLLFWPQGHAAVPSVGFPEFLTPHLEVYRTGATYPQANYVAYLAGDGSLNFRSTCKKIAAPLLKARVAGARVTRASAALVCTLPKPAQVDIVKVAGGTRLLLIVPPATVAAVATLKPAGSALTYSALVCAPAPAPS